MYKFIKPLGVIALCVAMPLAFAQSAGTPGPANPKEMGKPGTPANAGTGNSGALNSSDAKAASRPASGAMRTKKAMKGERAASAAPMGRPASAP